MIPGGPVDTDSCYPPGNAPGTTVPRPVPSAARACRRTPGRVGTAWASWRSTC